MIDYAGLFIVFGLLIAGIIGGALWLIIAGASRAARQQPKPTEADPIDFPVPAVSAPGEKVWVYQVYMVDGEYRCPFHGPLTAEEARVHGPACMQPR